MSRPRKIECLLSDDQLVSFRAFVADRRRTIDQCRAWLIGRGIAIGRHAVWNYVSLVRSRPAELMPISVARVDAGFRRELAGLAARLNGAALENLVSFAVYLVDATAGATVRKEKNRGHPNGR